MAKTVKPHVLKALNRQIAKGRIQEDQVKIIEYKNAMTKKVK